MAVFRGPPPWLFRSLVTMTISVAAICCLVDGHLIGNGQMRIVRIRKHAFVAQTQKWDESKAPSYFEADTSFKTYGASHTCSLVMEAAKFDAAKFDADKFICIDPITSRPRLIRPLDRDREWFINDTVHFNVSCRSGAANHPVEGTRFAIAIQDANDNAPEIRYNSTSIELTNGNPTIHFNVTDPDRHNLTRTWTPLAKLDQSFDDRFNFSCALQGHPKPCNLTMKASTSPGLYYVPIHVSDGTNSLTRYLPVHVLAKSYTNTIPRMNILVFTRNGDKTIYLGGAPAGIAENSRGYGQTTIENAPAGLGSDGRNITLNPSKAENSPDLRARFTRGHSPNPGEETDMELSITLTKFHSRDLKSPGSLRIRNINAQDFLRPLYNGKSQYEILHESLSHFFQVHLSFAEVHIFSIMPENSHPEVLQIYYTVSGHKSGTYLNALLASHLDLDTLNELKRKEIEIVQIGVNDCVFENCGGGCINKINVTDEQIVLEAESTRFIGLRVDLSTEQHCQQPKPINCSGAPCRNRGLCHQVVGQDDIFCECKQPGAGIFCQGRTRSFDGTGYAWFDPIIPCDQMHLSFYFKTDKPKDTVLLYNGPLNDALHRSNNIYLANDAIDLRLIGGQVSLHINFGGKEHPWFLASQINGGLTDGQWHKVEVLVFDKELSLIIDDMHKVSKVINGEFSQLNLNDPLQLGGRENEKPLSFDGCIRDLVINGMMIDLTNPIHSTGSEAGCKGSEKNCRPTCVHGLCIASPSPNNKSRCDCDIGYVGETCDQKAVWHRFDANSYVKFHYTPSGVPLSNLTDVQMLVMPVNGNQEGSLYHLESLAKDPYEEQLKLTSGSLNYSFIHNNPNGHRHDPTHRNISLLLPSPLKALTRYHVQLRRNPTSASLTVDSGLPPWRIQTNGYGAANHGNWEHFVIGDMNTLNRGFRGCIAQIVHNDHPAPLPKDPPQQSPIRISNVSPDLDQSDCSSFLITCANNGPSCTSPFQACKDFWKGAFCTCASDANPMFDDDDNWIGCSGPSVKGWLTGLVIAVVVCLLIFLCLLLVCLLWCCRRRKRRRSRPFAPLPPSPAIHTGPLPDDLGKDDTHGAGEANQAKYDKDILKVPILTPSQNRSVPLSRGSAIETGPLDEKRLYGVEMPTDSVGSLSPLPSEEDDSDLNWIQQLESLGPKFARMNEIR